MKINQPGLLVNGTNVLAIHALNRAADAERMLVQPTLDEIRDTGELLSFDAKPSPGEPNTEGIFFVGFTNSSNFSLSSRTFHDRITVELMSDEPAGVIRYTTDHSVPTE